MNTETCVVGLGVEDLGLRPRSDALAHYVCSQVMIVGPRPSASVWSDGNARHLRWLAASPASPARV